MLCARAVFISLTNRGSEFGQSRSLGMYVPHAVCARQHPAAKRRRRCRAPLLWVENIRNMTHSRKIRLRGECPRESKRRLKQMRSNDESREINASTYLFVD